jgi:L-aspartate oxidase
VRLRPCHEDTVKLVATEGPSAIRRLVDWGVHFSESQAKPGEYDLTREGGHSERRVLHYKDTTGAEIERALLEAIRREPNISVLEHHFAVDLVTNRKLGKSAAIPCAASAPTSLNQKTGTVEAIAARVTLLATAVRARSTLLYVQSRHRHRRRHRSDGGPRSARMANLEFVQFHPTCLFHPEAKSFLITERCAARAAS